MIRSCPLTPSEVADRLESLKSKYKRRLSYHGAKDSSSSEFGCRQLPELGFLAGPLQTINLTTPDSSLESQSSVSRIVEVCSARGCFFSIHWQISNAEWGGHNFSFKILAGTAPHKEKGTFGFSVSVEPDSLIGSDLQVRQSFFRYLVSFLGLDISFKSAGSDFWLEAASPWTIGFPLSQVKNPFGFVLRGFRDHVTALSAGEKTATELAGSGSTVSAFVKFRDGEGYLELRQKLNEIWAEWHVWAFGTLNEMAKGIVKGESTEPAISFAPVFTIDWNENCDVWGSVVGSNDSYCIELSTFAKNHDILLKIAALLNCKFEIV